MANQIPVGPYPLPDNLNAITHICCIGARRESVLSMAVMASQHPNIQFVVVDYDAALLEDWVLGQIDWVEPGLEFLLNDVMNENFLFSDQVDVWINQAQIIFIGIDIPRKTGGLPGLDLTEWEIVLRNIVAASAASKIIVEKTPMPIDSLNHSVRFLAQRPAAAQALVQFAVFSNPDFVSPGLMIFDLVLPRQVVIARKSDVGNPNLLVQLYNGWVDFGNITVLPNYLCVELGKIVTNVAAGIKITAMNIIDNHCDKIGANFSHVRQIVALDYRFGNACVDSTFGIGAPDLARDLHYYALSLKESRLDAESQMLQQVLSLDRKRQKQFVSFVLTNIAALRGKEIAVVGVTYKPNISDLTNSPAIRVCKALQKEGALLRIIYPSRNEDQIMGCFSNPIGVQVVDDMGEACSGAHAVLFCVLTAAMQFNFPAIMADMAQPPQLFFAHSLFNNIDYEALRQIGFIVHVFGN